MIKLSYYCGLYYEKIVIYLNKFKRTIIITPILSTALLLSLYHLELLSVHSSKRIDILFHTVAIGAFIIYFSRQIKQMSKTVVLISQYSFGIYLLHFFYILLADTVFKMTTFNLGITYIFILFFFSTICSIITMYYVNRWKYGKYLIGKIGIALKSKGNLSSKQTALTGKTSAQLKNKRFLEN